VSEEQPQVITVDGEDHVLSDFSDHQKYLMSQIQDLTSKTASLQFQLDQASVAKQWFTDNLVESLKEKDPEDA